MADDTEQDGQESPEDQGQESQDQQGEAQPDPESDFDSLPEATKAEIRQLRRENQRLRRTARDSSKGKTAPDSGPEAILAKLAEALGVEVGAGPAKGMPKATGSDHADELRLAKVELAVYRVAGAAGADPDALLDSRSFLREIEDLDPGDADFEKGIRDATKAALGQNPNLRAKSQGGQQRKPPGKSGGDLTGGKSASEQEFLTPQDRLRAAYAASSGT